MQTLRANVYGAGLSVLKAKVLILNYLEFLQKIFEAKSILVYLKKEERKILANITEWKQNLRRKKMINLKC